MIAIDRALTNKLIVCLAFNFKTSPVSNQFLSANKNERSLKCDLFDNEW